jgi:DNA-binding IclR family transcriptional regulator
MIIDDETLGWRLLEALYELGRADRDATPAVLSTWVDAEEADVRRILTGLEAQGLVDAGRCRLSMQGLVLAVSIHGAQKLARQSNAA